MKTIQITIDEPLLTRLDASEEVRRTGRSAVLRRALSDYLDRQRRAAIAKQYRQAYGADPGLGGEFEGWEDQGAWPTE